MYLKAYKLQYVPREITTHISLPSKDLPFKFFSVISDFVRPSPLSLFWKWKANWNILKNIIMRQKF